MKRNVSIDEVLKPLAEAETQAYISNALQVADLVEWSLKQLPSGCRPVVRQTTFSISEEFIRRIHSIKKKYPAKFIVIIDRKALNKTVQLWPFIHNVYDEVWMSDNHSKIILISSGDDVAEKMTVSFVTSQNLTRGNRAESCMISANNDIYYKLFSDFEDLRVNNSMPMDDIMGKNNALPVLAAPDDAPSVPEVIEQLAGNFVPVSDIATVLELDPGWLRMRLADPKSPEGMAYARGKAKAKIAIRAQEMELARIGSPQGLMSVRENLLQMEQDED